MLKSIYRYILPFCFLFIAGCSYNPIKEINRLANKSSRLISVSISKVGGIIAGRLWIKEDKYIKEIVIWFKGNLNLLQFNKFNNQWVYIGHTTINFNDKTIETMDIYPDKTPQVEKYTIPKNLKLFDKFVWEDSPRGVAIHADKILLKHITKRQFDSNFWKCFEGFYDLSDEPRIRLSDEGLKGKLVLWWSIEDKSCVEIYINDLEVPIVMRRIWLNHDLKEEFNPQDPQSINDFFLKYVKLASFNEFYEEFIRLNGQ